VWQSRARIPQCSKCKSTHVKELTLNEGADRPPAIAFDKLNEASMNINENLNESLIEGAEHSGSDGSTRFNEMSAVSGMLMVLGVLLLLGAAGWWLMTRRGHSSPLTRGQLAPWE